jgi:hypothetical protein
METDNNGNDFNSEPRSNPEVMYGTLIGGPGTNDGIRNREGTWGRQTGLVVTGFGANGYNMTDNGWVTGWDTQLFVKDSCFFNNATNFPTDVNCIQDPEDPDATTGDEDCNDYSGTGDVTDEANYFPENTELLTQAVDPQLPAETTAPPDTRPSANGGTPDYTVGNDNCTGAFGPEDTDWTTGWTAFPAN